MTTAPDWLRERADAPPPSRLARLRRASLGARLLYGSAAVVVLALLYGAVDFSGALSERNAARARVEQAAVDAVPAGLTVHARGVVGDRGYAGAFSASPPGPALDGVRVPAGWTPVEGTRQASAQAASGAWLSGERDLLLDVAATGCDSPRAPSGCPPGGSVLRVEVLPFSG